MEYVDCEENLNVTAGRIANWKNAASTIQGFQYREGPALTKHKEKYREISSQSKEIIKKFEKLGITLEELDACRIDYLTTKSK
ncbi:MAG: hypothetical protein ABH808_00125 [Candidatus Kuenenbacteria bacterium]